MEPVPSITLPVIARAGGDTHITSDHIGLPSIERDGSASLNGKQITTTKDSRTIHVLSSRIGAAHDRSNNQRSTKEVR